MEEGYLLLDENIIYEEGKYYFMMKVHWQGEMSEDRVRSEVKRSWLGETGDISFSELARQYGAKLLLKKDRTLKEYLEKMLADRRQIAEHLEKKADAANPKTMQRRSEINEEILLITRALEWYDNGQEAD